MKFGLPISLIAHFSLAFGGLVLWGGAAREFTDVRILPLKLVTVDDISNIKPVVKEPVEDPNPIEVFSEPEPEIPTESPDRELPVAPPGEPSKPMQKSTFNLDDFEALVKQLREENPGVKRQEILQSGTGTPEPGEYTITGIGPSTGLTIRAEEYIQAKMLACYKIDRGAEDYLNLRVEVQVHLGINGGIEGIDVLNNSQILASPNNSWRAARDNVISALNQCAPYDKLPKSDYDNWKKPKLNFQPSQ